MAITTAKPSVRGTKIQCYMAVRANWALDQSISEVSILSIISLVVRVKRQSSIARVL